jgi:hypothetical protein
MSDRARNRIVHDLAEDLINSWEEDPETLIYIARFVVDALIDRRVVVPEERWTEQCPRCEQIIGNHRVDGSCPDLFTRAALDILYASRDDDPEALADALERLDMADHEPTPQIDL